jgi:Fe2+ or Zn2+ uptake regulation protein
VASITPTVHSTVVSTGVHHPGLPNPELGERIAARLHDVQQRLTPKRAAIVDVLARASGPLTIPEILAVASDLAQSSVYRNLVVLEDAGIVHRVVTSNEFARYELAEELTGHHHHLICTRCGTVEDVPASSGLEDLLAETVTTIDSLTGFHTSAHRIDLVGVCGRCA